MSSTRTRTKTMEMSKTEKKSPKKKKLSPKRELPKKVMIPKKSAPKKPTPKKDAKKKDKYDEAMENLLKYKGDSFQDAVFLYWSGANAKPDHPIGCLFQHATPSGEGGMRRDGSILGCLTTIRSGIGQAFTKELTEAIRMDKDIPTSPRYVTRENLHKFAEWQRRLDREIRNKK